MAYIDWWNRTGPITMGERFGLNEISTRAKTLSPTKSYTAEPVLPSQFDYTSPAEMQDIQHQAGVGELVKDGGRIGVRKKYLAGGLLRAAGPLWKIAKPYVKKNMPRMIAGADKIKKRFMEKLYKIGTMRDVASKVKKTHPHLKKGMNNRIRALNKYEDKITSGWKGLREKRGMIRKKGKDRVVNYKGGLIRKPKLALRGF